MHTPPLILVVDDDPDQLEIAGTRLKAVGFVVENAVSAAESYEKARTLKPDLVLMDINMPGITGTQAVLDFKSTPGLRDTKLAFLTSQADPWPEVFKGGAEMAKQLGVEAFFDKTKDIETLGSKVAELLGLPLVPK
jgi:CheY-like chemotaxis protein